MTTKKAIANKPSAELANYDYGDNKGQGFGNTTQADYAVPFLAILQKGSPQIGEEDGCIEGAMPGMFLNTVTGEIMSGKDGIIFVPCCTQHVFVEWVSRDSGGGFVAVHEMGSDVVAKARAEAKEFGKYKIGDNDLVETFYMYGMVLSHVDSTEPEEMAVIAFTSTKIKKYRRAMSALRTLKGSPPLYAFRLHLSTVSEKNQHGTFYNFDIKPALGSYQSCLIPPSLDGEKHPLIVAGETMYDQVQSGFAKAAHDSVSNAAPEGSGDEVF